MQIFERNQNQIRILNPELISYKQWNQIFTQLNYLGYDMPDIDSVKEYYSRGTWLNEDQSLATLKIFGQPVDEFQYSPKQIQQDIQTAVEVYGLTTRPEYAGYLLPNGTMLDFSEGQMMRTLDHRDIYHYITHDETISQTDAMVQFMNYGCVRMLSGGFDLSKPLTDAQKHTLASVIRNNDQLYVDISNLEGHTVASFQYDYPLLSTVWNDIDQFFQSITLDFDNERSFL